MRPHHAISPLAAEDISSTHTWQIFHRPQDTWKAMYQDCARAKTSIEFEQYILENDSVGQRFMELFIEKAKQGIKVFIICDTFGSSLLHSSSLVKELRQSGGRLHFYNSFSGWKMVMPWLWLPRTHTKTLLIDSKIAYTGGVCMAERMRNWRDTHIRIEGPVTAQIRRAFDDIENRILHKRGKKIAAPEMDHGFSYFLNQPNKKRRDVYREFCKAINAASDYIYITSAFFVPNRRFLRLLKKATQRGVDVRVLVPERSDVIPADWVCLSYTRSFFKAGLRLFHYRENILHSKTAVIDDKWATVGSTNFDVISFFHNREANIVTTDKSAIAELKKQFFDDMEFSVELNAEAWKKIPMWKKIAGFALRISKVVL